MAKKSTELEEEVKDDIPVTEEAEVTEDLTEDVEEPVEEDIPDEPAMEEEAVEQPQEPKAADKKVQDPDKMVALKSSRFAYEVTKASKKETKERYRSEHVVTEFGDEDVQTEATLMKQDYLELVASSKSQKILEGVINGFHYAGEPRKSTVLAEVEFGYGLYNVVIPSYLLYDYDESKYIDASKIQTIENHVLRMVGAKVKFIVRTVDDKNTTAYGDRLMAQGIIGHDNYIKNTRDGRPRIVKDLIVKAQIIYTQSSGIIVDAIGCDIAIKKEELSHSYVGDAREEFSVGDYVNVRISDISSKVVEKNNTNYKLITAIASVKNATPNHKKKLYEQFKVDGKYAAEVTYITESGVFCRLRGGIDCLVALPRFGQNPRRGQKKIVKITGKEDEQLFIYGVFVNN